MPHPQLVVFRTGRLALKALEALSREVRSAKTMTALERIARTATAVQKAFKPIKEVADKAGMVRSDADLKLAAQLAKLPKAKGTRGQLRNAGPGRGKKGKTGGSLLVPPVSDAPTLAQLGVDKKWAARARALSRIPAADRHRITNELSRAGEDVTPTNIIKHWKVEQREAKRSSYARAVSNGGSIQSLEALARSGQKFATIYADPPWTFEVYSGKGKERSAERHYDTMTLAQIAALPVRDLALDDCALFLWAVWPELPGALEVIKAWGFEYKTAGFVWVKQNKKAEGLFTGMGYWTRANTEPCLLATRGSPTRLSMDVHQVILSPVREHSTKPEVVPNRIERLVPGPYLELFARKTRARWTTWGNEVVIEEEAA